LRRYALRYICFICICFKVFVLYSLKLSKLTLDCYFCFRYTCAFRPLWCPLPFHFLINVVHRARSNGKNAFLFRSLPSIIPLLVSRFSQRTNHPAGFQLRPYFHGRRRVASSRVFPAREDRLPGTLPLTFAKRNAKYDSGKGERVTTASACDRVIN